VATDVPPNFITRTGICPPLQNSGAVYAQAPPLASPQAAVVTQGNYV
jgi:hypothetical protein